MDPSPPPRSLPPDADLDDDVPDPDEDDLDDLDGEHVSASC